MSSKKRVKKKEMNTEVNKETNIEVKKEAKKEVKKDFKQDEVLVFKELDKKKEKEEKTVLPKENLQNLSENKEMDEISEFLYLTRKKDNLTKQEKKRLKQLHKYVARQVSSPLEAFGGWVCVGVVVFAVGLYCTLPFKIAEYYNQNQPITEEFLTEEDLVNQQYDELQANKETKKYAVVAIETLNVRSEPNEASSRLGQLSKKTEVEVVEELEGTDFIKINYQDGIGYIHKDFVEIVEKEVESAN